MTTVLFLALTLFFAAKGHAEAPEYRTRTGHPMSIAEALQALSKGQPVYRCQEVELKMSKSGRSLSLRAKKR